MPILAIHTHIVSISLLSVINTLPDPYFSIFIINKIGIMNIIFKLKFIKNNNGDIFFIFLF